MRAIHLCVPLLALGSACSGGDRDGGGSGSPEPPFAIRFVGTLTPVEELPATLAIEVTTTSGEIVSSWSGTVEIASLAGPATPTTLEVVDGAGEAEVVFELAGLGELSLSHPDLITRSISVPVEPRLPVKAAGGAAFGAVLAEGAGWDSDGAWAPAAIADGAGVRLYYASSSSGGAPHIGTAYSDDGLAFARAAQPVIGPAVEPSACHADGADKPSVIRRGDGTLVLLYEGIAGGVRRLCAATSTDGLSFTLVPGIAIDRSASPDAFDSIAVRGGSLVALEDGSLLAYYAGDASIDVDTTNPGPETVSGIGTAVSTNGGLAWTKVPGPVHGAHVTSFLESANVSSWDGLRVYAPAAFRDGTVYRVWLSGLSGAGPRIGLYENTSPFSFVSHVDNLDEALHEMVPVGLEGSFDDDGTELPSVVEFGGVRRIYYTGLRAGDGRRRIGVAAFPNAP